MQFPEDLRAAMQTVLDETPSRDVTRVARDLSQRYRAQHGRATAPLLSSELDAAAYVAYRLPATFAAIAAVLEEVQARRPDLEPASLLDMGGGPGTAGWAAAEVWPGLERITTLERDASMIRLGKRLAGHAKSPAIRQEVWHQQDLTAAWDAPIAELTSAAYLIGEIPIGAHTQLLQRLWDRTADTCVIVEPGTPRGYELIRRATDRLREAGAHIIAPFPLDWQCLESAQDWCHFSVRVPRTRLLRQAKEGSLSYEDEKFSYVTASRRPGIPIAARVIRHPQVRSGHIRLVLCTRAGVRHVVVGRSDREAYWLAKDLSWGSAISLGDAALFGILG